MCDDGNSVFQAKKQFCVAKFGNLGANGVKGSKFLVESVIFGIADPDLPIHYATFMGLQWWLRVVYFWVLSLLSIFGRKKLVSFWAKIWRFWGINRGFKLNVSFITPKRHILAWFHVFWAIVRKNPSTGLTCSLIKEKKGINKNNFCYISTICPEAPSEWISTKFGIGGLLADVINFAEFFVDRFRGIDFVGGWHLPIPMGLEGRR